jgi:hypothetical protein
MYKVTKMEPYKNFQLWALESETDDSCYIRIKEIGNTDESFTIILKEVNCTYIKGDESGIQRAIAAVKEYIDTHLSDTARIGSEDPPASR